MYYGEEIGMETTTRRAKTKCKTPSGSWDGGSKKAGMATRTPMQWTDGPERWIQANAKPWLPVSAQGH